ncbi:MAG: MATE family efflux transporter [Candidatus Wallbacteria bacterium]|nr:MATE family efflux transporter [Candidatus Wallbacteria bacterium]
MSRPDRSSMMRDTGVARLLWQLSAPAAVGMVVQALYSVVDTMFVGRGVGVAAIAGVTITFPVHMFFLALGTAIGIGGASLISRSLGAGEREKADYTAGMVLLLTIVTGIVFSVLSLLTLEPLLRLFGASAVIIGPAREYAAVILAGSVFFVVLVGGNSTVRAEGNASFAMYTMFLSAGLNVVLDAIFIFWLKRGVAGAAEATVISWIAACALQQWYFQGGRSMLRFRLKYLKPDWKIIREILAVGASAFGRNAAGSLMAVFVNRSLVVYGGDMAIAAFGVVNRLLMFFAMPMFGIVQGFLPIAGFSFGNRRPDRVREVLRLGVYWSTGISLVGFVLFMLFPGFFIGMFSSDPVLFGLGTACLRIMVLVMPLIGFQMIGSSLFQALGHAGKAFFLSTARQIFFLVPLLLILPPVYKLEGVWYAFPIADLLSFLVTLVFVAKEMAALKLREE